MELLAVVAGFGRKMLAWFVDGWMFISLVPALLLLLDIDPANYPVTLAIAFFVLRYVFERAWTTPGISALAIDIHNRVPWAIAKREDSVSIGLGIIAILSGTHILGIALANPSPVPLFGIVLPVPLFGITLFSIAVLVLTAGFLTARMMIAGWWIITITLALWIVSVLTGWQAWQELIVEMLVAKRQELGLDLRPGEVEILPQIAKVLLVLPPSIVLLMLIGTHAQFKMPNPVTADPALSAKTAL